MNKLCVNVVANQSVTKLHELEPAFGSRSNVSQISNAENKKLTFRTGLCHK